jgi:RimJ/RimL family protein N-acetyltransferase
MKENEPYKIFSWEKAWIKKPDANNPDDVEAIKRIDAQPGVQKWMVGPPLTAEDFSEENFYGFCEEENTKGISGFVYLYDADEELIDRLIGKKLIESSKTAKILEMSFARYTDPNIPREKQKRGITSSAARQIAFVILEKEKNILITGFTNPENLLSENAIKSVGFVLKGKILYDKDSREEDNFWILDKEGLEKILEMKKTNNE